MAELDAKHGASSAPSDIRFNRTKGEDHLDLEEKEGKNTGKQKGIKVK